MSKISKLLGLVPCPKCKVYVEYRILYMYSHYYDNKFEYLYAMECIRCNYELCSNNSYNTNKKDRIKSMIVSVRKQYDKVCK